MVIGGRANGRVFSTEDVPREVVSSFVQVHCWYDGLISYISCFTQIMASKNSTRTNHKIIPIWPTYITILWAQKWLYTTAPFPIKCVFSQAKKWTIFAVHLSDPFIIILQEISMTIHQLPSFYTILNIHQPFSTIMKHDMKHDDPWTCPWTIHQLP